MATVPAGAVFAAFLGLILFTIAEDPLFTVEEMDPGTENALERRCFVTAFSRPIQLRCRSFHHVILRIDDAVIGALRSYQRARQDSYRCAQARCLR